MREPLSLSERLPGGFVTEKRVAHYELKAIRRSVADGRFSVTGRVARHLRRKRWEQELMADVLLGLERVDFHKAQAHTEHAGQWLDIYRSPFHGTRLYVKFTVERSIIVVMSFCVDGEAH